MFVGSRKFYNLKAAYIVSSFELDGNDNCASNRYYLM